MNFPIFLAILSAFIIGTKCEEETSDSRTLQDSRAPVSGAGLPKDCGRRINNLDEKPLFSGPLLFQNFGKGAPPCKI